MTVSIQASFESGTNWPIYYLVSSHISRTVNNFFLCCLILSVFLLFSVAQCTVARSQAKVCCVMFNIWWETGRLALLCGVVHSTLERAAAQMISGLMSWQSLVSCLMWWTCCCFALQVRACKANFGFPISTIETLMSQLHFLFLFIRRIAQRLMSYMKTLVSM